MLFLNNSMGTAARWGKTALPSGNKNGHVKERGGTGTAFRPLAPSHILGLS